MTDFQLKDSGQRESFESGMCRDTEDGKIDYTLVLDGPMFKRWAVHLTKGAKKYDARNWMKASGEAEYERFKRSLLRHLIAYFDGERDEDHLAAAVFNINGMAYVDERRNLPPLTTRQGAVWPVVGCCVRSPAGLEQCVLPAGHVGGHEAAPQDGVTTVWG